MNNSQKGLTLIGLLVIMTVGAVIFFVVVLPFIGIHYQTGKGQHTGYITAVEKSGVIWKTGRAYIKTDLSSSQEDQYCVIDDSVYSRLEEASRNKEKLTIEHLSYLSAGITNCAGEDAVIIGIK